MVETTLNIGSHAGSASAPSPNANASATAVPSNANVNTINAMTLNTPPVFLTEFTKANVESFFAFLRSKRNNHELIRWDYLIKDQMILQMKKLLLSLKLRYKWHSPQALTKYQIDFLAITVNLTQQELM
eukprot:gene10078-7200_t